MITIWLWLLSIYPAASVAAFSFLSPIFGVFFGWAFLDEKLGAPILVALIARTGLKHTAAERQLMWQVLVSAPILLLAAPFFGPLVRDLQPIHLWGLAFQIVIIASFGYALWLWLLSIYPAASVAG